VLYAVAGVCVGATPFIRYVHPTPRLGACIVHTAPAATLLTYERVRVGFESRIINLGPISRSAVRVPLRMNLEL
jgi:hypothetical protein